MWHELSFTCQYQMLATFLERGLFTIFPSNRNSIRRVFNRLMINGINNTHTHSYIIMCCMMVLSSIWKRKIQTNGQKYCRPSGPNFRRLSRKKAIWAFDMAHMWRPFKHSPYIYTAAQFNSWISFKQHTHTNKCPVFFSGYCFIWVTPKNPR